MAVANAALDILGDPAFLDQVARKGLIFKQKLAGLVDQHPDVFETVRGQGLMLGLKGRMPATDIVAAARRHHLLVVGAGDNVVRLLPALTITEAEIESVVDRLDAAARDLAPRSASAPEGAAA
jgi:acetylornithine/N-succinyldiaminopimelate aminotransferase